MAKIETAFLISTEPGTESASVSEINPVVGADMKDHKDDLCKQTLTDEAREAAICRASALVEFFHSESRLYEALWRQHSDFGHKAAYDLALSNHSKSIEIRDSLMKGRKQ